MYWELFQGLMLPFIGTTLGAACVFFISGEVPKIIQRGLLGFAAGVMVAASIWSLIIPALEQAEGGSRTAIIPVIGGFWLGILFLLLLDKLIPHIHLNSSEQEGMKINIPKRFMMIFAVILHNIPEGMAIGVVYAGWYYGSTDLSLAAALALSLGIAIQNFPEGAIVSMPLIGEGTGKIKAFLLGTLSGAVEPIMAFITIIFAGWIIPVLPVLLSLAAGAMLYVVVEELIPEMAEGNHSNIGTVMFALGFTLMMTLDVLLG